MSELGEQRKLAATRRVSALLSQPDIASNKSRRRNQLACFGRASRFQWHQARMVPRISTVRAIRLKAKMKQQLGEVRGAPFRIKPQTRISLKSLC